MSNLPANLITFSNKTGIIPLNDLDTNFNAIINAVPILAVRAGTVVEGSQPNITEIGTLTTLSVTGGITASSVSSSQVSGTLTTPSQPNITQIGELGNLVVSNNITAGSILTTTIVGQLVTGSQPSISAVGALTNLSVTGNIDANTVLTGNIFGEIQTANQPKITGLGTLTSLNVLGNISGTLITANQSAITTVGTLTSLTVSGNTNLNSLSVTGNVSVGNLTTAVVNANSISGTLITPIQTNITSVGTLASLDVSGEISAFGNVSTSGGFIGIGDIIVNGNIEAKVEGFEIGFRNIPQIAYSANTTISSDASGKHYYTTTSNNTTLTIPSEFQAVIEVGTAITIVNGGTGTITIQPGAGVLLFLAGVPGVTTSRFIASFGMATLIKVNSGIWFINGTGIS